jgi:hypothetical protein
MRRVSSIGRRDTTALGVIKWRALKDFWAAIRETAMPTRFSGSDAQAAGRPLKERARVIRRGFEPCKLPEQDYWRIGNAGVVEPVISATALSALWVCMLAISPKVETKPR